MLLCLSVVSCCLAIVFLSISCMIKVMYTQHTLDPSAVPVISSAADCFDLARPFLEAAEKC